MLPRAWDDLVAQLAARVFGAEGRVGLRGARGAAVAARERRLGDWSAARATLQTKHRSAVRPAGASGAVRHGAGWDGGTAVARRRHEDYFACVCTPSSANIQLESKNNRQYDRDVDKDPITLRSRHQSIS